MYTIQQKQNIWVFILGFLFLIAGIKIISEYVEGSSVDQARVYVQAAPLVNDMASAEAADTYRLILRRTKADAMLVQTPATLSLDLVENLGAPALMRRYAATMDSLSSILATLLPGYNCTYVPYHGWHLRMMRARDRFFENLESDASLQSLAANYRTFHRDIEREAVDLLREGRIFQLNLPSWDTLCQRDNARFDTLFGEVFAVEGGYSIINESYYTWIDEEIRSHPNRPLLILYDATQVWWLIERLEKRTDIELRRPLPRAKFSMFGRMKQVFNR